jgi:hypothetical protein
VLPAKYYLEHIFFSRFHADAARNPQGVAKDLNLGGKDA